MKTEGADFNRKFPVAYEDNGMVHFSFVSKEDDCGVILFDRKSGKEIGRYPFDSRMRVGDLHSLSLEFPAPQNISYLFYEKGRVVADKNGRAFEGHSVFGKEVEESKLRAYIPTENFDWEDDCNPQLSYAESICYCAHVRGFTRHGSSGVTHKGTFLGMVEKIPYLKETGITTVELQPVYEFLEIPSREERKRLLQPGLMGHPLEENVDRLCPARCNYWGYKQGYYYAPKGAYAAGNDPVNELKQLIREFHKQKLEVILQFYFPLTVRRLEIPEILRFWVGEYHVDGFHLMGENLPVEWICEDPVLSGTKLWYYSFSENTQKTFLAGYEDSYLYTMRRFLKGDEGMVSEVLNQMRRIPGSFGKIHYMSNYYGFSLTDMVSYDRKHNEENGEENRDGNDYNCSWNCGEEGPTRKRKIRALRRKQIKNAMTLLLFSQSTPLIFMGDEFGNSQKGNNNPYCQDNLTTWLDWRDLERNRELYDYWKKLVMLRREHPILRPEKEFRMLDSISCGYPDLSYHGENAWKLQGDRFCRQFGMMFCGSYATRQGREDAFFYLGVNMYWEEQTLALPDLPDGYIWQYVDGTEAPEKQPEGTPITDRKVLLSGRSCVICIGKPDPDASKKGKKQKKRA